ncbi:hypothetical protein ACP3VZ_03870 [Vibrio sp. PNB22_2_2]|uniref:hypothetical protein n=1 Tax=unclassified Vibrio TaxID=2614977 RepID=UPI00406A29C9
MKELVSLPLSGSKVITEIDILELCFNVKLSYEFQIEVINKGLKSANYNSKLVDIASEEDDSFIKFDASNREHLSYAKDTSLYQRLYFMWIYCSSSTKAGRNALLLQQIEYKQSGKNLWGFFEDISCEIFPIILSVFQFRCNTTMTTHLDEFNTFNYLVIKFFALIKLDNGGEFHGSTMTHQYLSLFGIHHTFFNFRELTLLSGYQSERAARNLANASTPKHKRIQVEKCGRMTYISRREILRWLSAMNRQI